MIVKNVIQMRKFVIKTGQIVRIISNLYTVKVDNTYIDARARGVFRNKNLTPLVGDYVDIDIDKKVILDIKNRISMINRPMGANIMEGLIVTSLKAPDLSLSLLDKQISYLIINNIKPVIVLTKRDLVDIDELGNIEEIFKYYDSIGIPVFYNTELNRLKSFLEGKLTCVTGQTGAGKSTLINKLGSLNIKTDEISRALGRGKHTTRHVEIYEIGEIKIMDTPGFSALDLNGITKEQLRDSFIEFKKYSCRFKDCMHNKEIDCGVKTAVGKEILPSRYENYIKLLGELNESSSIFFK